MKFFDFEFRKFTERVKYFSTSNGDTVFLSTREIEPEEIWKHGRKVHVYFPYNRFDEESSSFYHHWLKYLLSLEERMVVNPERQFYLHVLVYDSEAVSFVNYVMSALDAYLGWYRNEIPNGLDNIEFIKNMVRVIPGEYLPTVYRFWDEPKSGLDINELNLVVEPYQEKGIWDLAVEISTPKGLERFYMSDSFDLLNTITRVKKVDRVVSREQTFAVSTIMAYVETQTLRFLVSPGSDKINVLDLIDFLEYKGKFAKLTDPTTVLQQKVLSKAYRQITRAYEAVLKAQDEIKIESDEGDEDE